MIERGTGAFWRTSLALFAAGMATFALLYCVQPLLPVFSGVFGLSAAVSSLSLSMTTLPLAFAMLGASILSDRVGRKGVMVASLLASAMLCAACAAAPGFAGLVALRALMGLSLSGLPAVAMAYVSEEMSADAAGLGMGLYIGGSAIGGMSGRLLSAMLAQHLGWRAALLGVASVGLACGGLLWRFLPASRHFSPEAVHLRSSAAAIVRHLRAPVLRCLFAEGFLLMGGFVSVYNYIGYRLLAPPYGLSQGTVGLIFSVYPVGVLSSAVMGALAMRLGRRPVLGGNIVLLLAGALLTLAYPVWAVVLGVACVTAGFFGAHSVASAWVGFAARKTHAEGAAPGSAQASAPGGAQASALYLFAYYAGSSVAGSALGLAWAASGWPGVVAGVAALGVAALAVAAWLPGAVPAVD